MNIFNIKDFGAVGDGQTLDSKAIQDAVCNASEVAGTVFFPPGDYKTGTIFLKSDITLQLCGKAKVLGSTDIEDYSNEITGCIESPDFKNTLFYAENEKNISFTGEGTIDGVGSAFVIMPDIEILRPMMMRFVGCRNIKFEGIELKDSGSWCCHMISCKDIFINNLRLNNHGNRNNDGFDLDSCENVSISNTHINSIDDSICLKSTTDTPCSNIAISNCIISSETATIKFGTSSKAGFSNIAISNCVFYDCPMGTIKLICVDGGVLENITINNITMENVGSPLFIRTGKRNLTFETPKGNDFWGPGEKNDRKIGEIRNILISNIRADVSLTDLDKTPMMITGLKESKVKNITLSNFNITFAGGGSLEDSMRKVDEDPYKYPEQWFFGILPAYALYARHVAGLKMDNMNFILSGEDKREAVIFEDVSI